MDPITIFAIALSAAFFLFTVILTMILERRSSNDHKDIAKAVAVIERFSDLQSQRMFSLIEEQSKDNRKMLYDTVIKKAESDVGDSISIPEVKQAIQTTARTAMESFPDDYQTHFVTMLKKNLAETSVHNYRDLQKFRDKLRDQDKEK